MMHRLTSLLVFALLLTTPSLRASAQTGRGATAGSHESPSYSAHSDQASSLPQATLSSLELIGQIGGSVTAAAVVGDSVYAGVGPRLVVLSVADPAHPSLVGQTDVLPSMVQSLVAAGRYVYVATGFHGLRVIDVINPAAPVEVGFFTKPGAWIRDVAMVGHTIYAISSGGLSVLDVTNPIAPVEIGNCAIPGPDGGVAVAAAGQTVYVASLRGGLRVIDVTNPAAPVEVGFYQTSGWAEDVTVMGRYVYVATAYRGGLRVIDVANPAAPVEVGSYATWGDAWHVAAAGGYAYVADDYGLSVLNMANPAMPVKVGILETHDTATDVDTAGGYAFVADPSGLRVIQVPDPAMAPAVGFYNTPDAARGWQQSGATLTWSMGKHCEWSM